MRKHFRLAAIAALALALLAGAAYVARGDGGATPQDGDAAYLRDDVTSAIDRALGRPDSAPNQEAARGAASAPAPLPPVAGGLDAGAASRAAGAVPPDASTAASVDDRKIVQTASVRLQVKDVGGSFEEVGRLAAAAGGFVASSNFALQGDQQVATVTIRIPADRYQQTLSQVRALGAKVEGEASNASDVTEEYSDLSARLRNLEATEAQLLQLLARANSVGDILQVQDRINSVRGDIERVKGRIALLDKRSDLATITVQLRPVVAVAKTGGTSIGDEISRAWQDSLDFLAGIAGAVLSVVVFSWWLLPLAGIALLLWQRWLRPGPKPATYD